MIERTPKKWKAFQAIGAVVLVLGIGAFMGKADQTVAAMLTGVGLLAYGIGRFGAWWKL